jgi:hypothetical protein
MRGTLFGAEWARCSTSPSRSTARFVEEAHLVAEAVHLVEGVLPHLDLVQRDAGELDHRRPRR